jgi:hypothetical protein
MKGKRGAGQDARRAGDSSPARGGSDRRRGPEKSRRTTTRPPVDAPPRGGRPRGAKGSTPAIQQRPQRSGPQTTPTRTPTPAKNASQAKARAKARKAKAPKVVRPPLRERLIARLARIDLRPRTLAAKVPFVVLVIGSLGVGLGVTLWLSTDSAERSYQLGHARQLNEALTQQKEALEREVLEAQAAPALAESARNLGMIPSKDTAHLVQDASGNWVVVGNPKPAEGVPPPPLNSRLPDDTPAPPAANPAPVPVNTVEVPVRLPAPGAPVSAGPEVPVGVQPAAPLGAAAAPVPAAPLPAAAPLPVVNPGGPAIVAAPGTPALGSPPINTMGPEPAAPLPAAPPAAAVDAPQGPNQPSPAAEGEQFTPVATSSPGASR